MSYFAGPEKGYGFAPGFFIAHDGTEHKETAMVAANHAQAVTRDDGRKVVPAGAVIPANDATAKGILYEDIDVTNGDKPGSIVTEGTIYGDRLPAPLSEDTTEGGATVPGAATALTGIRVVTSPTITRPDFS